MKRALVLNAIYPAIGGILISSERSTRRSTASRPGGLIARNRRGGRLPLFLRSAAAPTKRV